MEDVKERLIKCFSAVFPELSPHEIVMTASPSTTGAGDSLTAVTLLAIVEEEFGIELNGKLEDMSFENIQARITEVVESPVRAESARVSTAKLG